MRLYLMLTILILTVVSFVLFSGCIEEEEGYTITYVVYDDRYGTILTETICSKKEYMLIETIATPPGGAGGGRWRYYAITEGYYKCTWVGSSRWLGEDPSNTLEYQAYQGTQGRETEEWRCEAIEGKALEDYINTTFDDKWLWQEWESVINDSDFRYDGTRIIEGINIEAECYVSHAGIKCFHPDTHILLLAKGARFPTCSTIVTYVNMKAPKDSVFNLST